MTSERTAPVIGKGMEDEDGSSRAQPVLAPRGQAEAEPSGRWRKRPIVVDAYQFHNRVGTDTRPAWIMDAVSKGQIKFTQPRNAPGYLTISTLEGEMRADAGDWIVKGVAGEIYPCKPDIFAVTYEPSDTSGANDKGPGMKTK